MLSCKTDSAKLTQPGGPVSRFSNLITTRTGCCAKISDASSRTTMSRTPAALAVTPFATTARTSLQQGVLVAGFFFAGEECIGQELDAASETGATAPSAQWFERENQAMSVRTTVNAIIVLPVPFILVIS
jgi:hypothetical protein